MTTGKPTARRSRKVVMEPAAADELIDLIDDVPGDADEHLLDQALEAFGHPYERIPTPDQERAAEGEVVAIEVRPETIDAVTTLVTDDRDTEPKVLRRLAGRLRSKLKQAGRRSRSGR